MPSKWARTLITILDRPLWGTKVIPRDARADPSRLPEEEFPVNCPKCDYLLRGLPDGRCPECGTPFDRGRLLVMQYAVDWGAGVLKRTGRGWGFSRSGSLGIVFVLVGNIGMASLDRWEGTAIMGWNLSPKGRTVVWLLSFGSLLIGVCCMFMTFTLSTIYNVRYTREAKRLRRRVIDAILPSKEGK